MALRNEDARALGLLGAGDRFDVAVQTANGVVAAKRIRLGSVRLGSITVHDVEALVSPPGALATNLLGMTFLSRLQRIEAKGGRLTLED